ncbi:DUF2500 domain-containing protein [Zobellella aerophila]|uniref:DUF2500 domain-containing protein n=1 Tax=Zobellella aerophila TaxID=870480 RepID=A0ABP6WKD9_9GAMM
MDQFVLWGIIAFAVIVLGRRLYVYFHNNRQSHHSLRVRIAGKHKRQYRPRRSNEQTGAVPKKCDYYVSFSPLDGGTEQAFRVSEHLFEQMHEGNTGVLVIQGSRFIAFESDDVILDND